ncbi:biopolymer transporter ExbD [Pedobacter chinensis]|uniref:Biopolymer transporter ExbD n=1 Tax=Pedobacter chinensis TaxID=2282421 RepID=A0A369Q3T2_9SPHI|nr:biopolymer transporter ExbD [Pedobacter chinensis]RDC56988.1 biopolymer transporter ExbD [Pedobacter chinensis]
MATLNESQSGKAVKGRTRKTAPRVDLTAMVDLMFLLTTFFMLTTSLGTLNAADIAKPDQCDQCEMDYPASRTMTVLLGKNDETVSYIGTAENADMKVTPVKNIQDEINSNKLLVAKAHHNNPVKYMIVIIKPTKTAKFQNFVDLVDEMKIADIKSYSIDDKNISAKETDFMKAKGL